VAFRSGGTGYVVGRENYGQILQEGRNCTWNRHEEGMAESRRETVAIHILEILDMGMVLDLADVEMVAYVVGEAIAYMVLAALVRESQLALEPHEQSFLGTCPLQGQCAGVTGLLSVVAVQEHRDGVGSSSLSDGGVVLSRS
jgi:hypothetical protein